MNQHTLNFSSIVIAALFLAACNGARYKSNDEVVVQVCIPDKRIYFDILKIENIKNHPSFTRYTEQELSLAPNTIRRVAQPDDVRLKKDPNGMREVRLGFTAVERTRTIASSVSSSISIYSATTSSQPIYETTLLPPYSNYVGLEVAVPTLSQHDNKEIHYWFKPPKIPSKEVFTAWYSPVSLEYEDFERKSISVEREIINGREMPIYPVSKNSPKMRVMLRSKIHHNNSSNDYLPAITTAKMQLESPGITSDFFHEFVPNEIENISNCN